VIERALARVAPGLALRLAAARIERRREARLGPAERRALVELRLAGQASEWDLRTAAAALAKATGLDPRGAAAEARASVARALAEGRVPPRPSLAEALAAIARGSGRRP
jgi:hypothetical protein